MNRTLILFTLLTFSICRPAFSHTFEAVAANENFTEVVLYDRETGIEWLAEVGDEIDGYRIVKITEDYVTIAKPGEDRVVFVTKIPLNNKAVRKVRP